MAGFPIYKQIAAQNVLFQSLTIKFFGMAPDGRSKDSISGASKLPFRFMIQETNLNFQPTKLLKLIATVGAILPLILYRAQSRGS